MKENAQINLLKAKHYLKINNIEYYELQANNHFRIFMSRTIYSNSKEYVDLWPTTLKWHCQSQNKIGNGIESFIAFYRLNSVNRPDNVLDKTKIYSRQPETFRDSNTYIERYKVPGGWLVQSMHLQIGVLALVFLPDPNNDWILEPIDEPIKPKMNEGQMNHA